MFRCNEMRRYQERDTGRMLSKAEVRDKLTMRHRCALLSGDDGFDGRFREWIDGHLTPSQCYRMDSHKILNLFLDDLLEDAEALREQGFETIVIPAEDIVTTPGLLAVGSDDRGRHASIEIGYVPATKGYVLDITLGEGDGRETIRIDMDGPALTYMGQEIKRLRQAIREEKEKEKEKGGE